MTAEQGWQAKKLASKACSPAGLVEVLLNQVLRIFFVSDTTGALSVSCKLGQPTHVNSAYRCRMSTETVPHGLKGTGWELQCLPLWFVPSRCTPHGLTANGSELLSGFITAYQVR